jgi:hypothetical protein
MNGVISGAHEHCEFGPEIVQVATELTPLQSASSHAGWSDPVGQGALVVAVLLVTLPTRSLWVMNSSSAQARA